MSIHIEDHLYGSFKSIYNESPQIVKSLLGRLYRRIPVSIRYGKAYKEYIDFLNSSQTWSKSRLEEFQWIKTINIVQHAYKHVPYYRKLFDERGIKLLGLQNFNDLKTIPYLTKKDIKDNSKNLLDERINKRKLLSVSTGGTTGTPLQLYYVRGISRSIEYAFTVHALNKINYKIGDKIAVLRGDMVYSKKNNEPSFYDPIRSRLVLSSFNMIDANLPYYIKRIKEFQPKFLHVYPSSLSILAQYMKRNQINHFPSVKGIIASSETIHQWQYELFNKIFKCKVFPWYGLNEQVALAGGCEYSRKYHIFPQYSYVELIEDFKFSDHHPNVSEIVGTSFENYAMPLIRYKTEDYAIATDKACRCGRNYKLLDDIIGRKQNFFVDKSGSLISFVYNDVPLWPVKEKINAYQYIQNEPGQVTLNIEPKLLFTENDKDKVIDQFLKIYSRFKIQIKVVKVIEKSPNGKFDYLKNNL